MSSDHDGFEHDELADSQGDADECSTAQIHPPIALSPTLYSFDDDDSGAGSARPKRRQVKNACTNCQNACKKCDDDRPCMRCVRYGLADECVSSPRKPRPRGFKRGPYKKRYGTEEDQADEEPLPGNLLGGGAILTGPPVPYGMSPPGGGGVPMSGLMGMHPTAFYGPVQAMPSGAGHAETPAFYQPVVLVPQQSMHVTAGEQPVAGPSAQAQQYYPALMPYQFVIPQPGAAGHVSQVFTPSVHFPYALQGHPQQWQQPPPPSSASYDERQAQRPGQGDSAYNAS